MRAGGDSVREYESDAFADAWERYLPPAATERGACSNSQDGTTDQCRSEPMPDSEGSNPDNPCDQAGSVVPSQQSEQRRIRRGTRGTPVDEPHLERVGRVVLGTFLGSAVKSEPASTHNGQTSEPLHTCKGTPPGSIWRQNCPACRADHPQEGGV